MFIKNSRNNTHIIIIFVLVLFLISNISMGQDLTPSVNYFNFDYDGGDIPDNLDSIIAFRYDALVADKSYTSSFVSKYNDIWAYDNTIELYVYINFNDPWTTSAGLGQVNHFVDNLMANDGEDSTDIYWHSADYTPASFGAYTAFADNENGSILRTYGGTRALVNNTNLNFIHHFASYADSIKNKYSATKNYTVAGLWFDNMNCPQTLGVSGETGRTMYEPDLGSGCPYGGEPISDWHINYRDTVLLKYATIVAETLLTRLNLKVSMNRLDWAYALFRDFAYGYSPEYFDGDLVAPANSSFEYGGSPYRSIVFDPGPPSFATSIDKEAVSVNYDPVKIYAGMVDCSFNGVENWFNPANYEPGGPQKDYGWKKRYYDCLALYYLWRSKTTFLSLSSNPSDMTVYNWLNDAAAHAGEPGDSAYWIDAVGVRVGRDDDNSMWDYDTVSYYCASVSCPDCIITEGVGKDDEGFNYVVFRRRWQGDDGFKYMVLLRPYTSYQKASNFATNYAPGFSLENGPWSKLDFDGNWGGNISTDSLRIGEGAIYRMYSGQNDSIPPASIQDLRVLPD